jgi:branched-chain amino acid transport system substrate-binding protein
MNISMLRRIGVLIMIAGIFFLWTCSKAGDSNVIKIGVIGPMQYSQGKGHWNGAELAMEEINSSGGIKVGNEMKKIKLVKADSNEIASITDAANAMERLMTQEKVDFVIGGFRTEAVLAMQDIAMDAKIIFISVGPASGELNKRVGEDYNKYKYFFRGSPLNSLYLVKNCFIHLGYVAAVLKKTLNLPVIKTAVVAEKVQWVEPVIEAAKGAIPAMGMELAGIWQPSQTASDVTAELSAIQRSGAHIIFTIFSTSVGVTFVRQAGELKIPAIMIGINVEAAVFDFWEKTEGKCAYVIATANYLENITINETSKKFIEAYKKKYGEMPPYTAFTHSAISNLLRPAIEEAGTLDADALIPILENLKVDTSSGTYKADENHDSTWGPGYSIVMAGQWQDGSFKGIWPNNWKPSDNAPVISYEGVVPVKIPPWMIEAYK